MIIKPLGKRVLIQEVKQEEITKSGIQKSGKNATWSIPTWRNYFIRFISSTIVPSIRS